MAVLPTLTPWTSVSQPGTTWSNQGALMGPCKIQGGHRGDSAGAWQQTKVVKLVGQGAWEGNKAREAEGCLGCT